MHAHLNGHKNAYKIKFKKMQSPFSSIKQPTNNEFSAEKNEKKIKIVLIRYLLDFRSVNN